MHTENNTTKDQALQNSKKSGFDIGLKGEQFIKTIPISKWIESPKGAPVITTLPNAYAQQGTRVPLP